MNLLYNKNNKGDVMKSVKQNKNTIIIKNSKFICLLYKIQTKEEINILLEQAHQEYPNATHYCYAYILDNQKLATDDGEPANTAGIPILQVLEKNRLNYVLCIVVRYFGKIKLGAGGLVRAYTKSVVECLKEHIIELKEGFYISITFDYNVLKKVDYILKENSILKKSFQEKITYHLYTTTDIIEALKNISNITIKIHHRLYLEN